MKLRELKAVFEEYIVFQDSHILDIMFATLVGNTVIERDPVWLMIVAPSSAGKTTLVSPLIGIPHIYFVDDMTEKTLLSGYKVKGKESSLLKMIGSGMMAFSDFTSILSKNPNSRGEILTQLKLVYDRKVTKYTGTGASAWEGKIGVIAASTPDIYTFMESGRSMGERFLYYWLEQPTNEQIMRMQMKVTLSSKEITDIMAPHYGSYMESIMAYSDRHGIPPLKMTEEQRVRLHAAAVFCVYGKATIRTNFKSGKPEAIPTISGVGRDIKIFDTVLHALQLMSCYEHDDLKRPVHDWMIEVVEKCAYSSINRERRKVLEILAEASDTLSASQIGAKDGLGLEKEAVELYLQPLHAVGLVKKVVSNNIHKWTIESDWTRAFVRRMQDGAQVHRPAPVVEDNTTQDYSDDPLAGEFENTANVL